MFIAKADNAGGTEASVGTSWFVLEKNIIGALMASNNLSDLANAGTARTNLGLGTLATQNGTFSGTSSGTNTGDETGARVATLLHAASAKSTLVDADEVNGTDSAASFGLIRTTWSNVWTYIKSKADSIYQATLVSATNIKTINGSSLLGAGDLTVGGGGVTEQALTDGATINWNMASGTASRVTIAGNRTIAAPTNLVVGPWSMIVTQDGTGSRTLTWNAAFKWPGGTAPVLSTAGGAIDIISGYCNGTVLYGSYVRGMA